MAMAERGQGRELRGSGGFVSTGVDILCGYIMESLDWLTGSMGGVWSAAPERRQLACIKGDGGNRHGNIMGSYSGIPCDHIMGCRPRHTLVSYGSYGSDFIGSFCRLPEFELVGYNQAGLGTGGGSGLGLE